MNSEEATFRALRRAPVRVMKTIKTAWLMDLHDPRTWPTVLKQNGWTLEEWDRSQYESS